jgi:hypothetical protein
VSNLFYVPGLGKSVNIPPDKSSGLVNILRAFNTAMICTMAKIFALLTIAGFFIIASMLLWELRSAVKTNAKDFHVTIRVLPR